MSTPEDKRLNEARGFMQRRNYSQAILAYERLSRQYPHRIEIWFEYGCAAGGDGQMELADRAWRKAMELAPKNAQLMLQIGHQNRNLRRLAQARASFEQAAAADPNGINPRMALAILSEQEHRFETAREHIASCLAIDPGDDQARYFEALLDRRQNKVEDAERRLRDLISSEPQHQYVQYASRYELAEVLNRTERFDEAMQMLAEAKKLVRALG
ncbi:MAG TPA: tetratricopeptide repeat protein, partial [Verrucomicrobiae bacterium]|nr:tetratricopeptide repeat protein [Verrucomicrobiae bacterium]